MKREVPQYVRVYNSIKKRIEKADYEVGSFLPPEPELQKQFGVSRITVRKAVELLERQGFVNIQQGRGTTILDFKATQKLQYVTSFSETLIERGFVVDHQLVSIGIENSNDTIAASLGIANQRDRKVVRIVRIAFANKKPIALMTNYILADIVPGILEKAGRIKSLYHFLEEEYALIIDSATDFISADIASEEEADQLEILTGAPLLTVRRISHRNGKPVELVYLRIIADRYEYSVYTKDRPPRAE